MGQGGFTEPVLFTLLFSFELLVDLDKATTENKDNLVSIAVVAGYILSDITLKNSVS